MAYITKDKRTGNLCVRAYAGINPQTGKPCTANKSIPGNSTQEAIAAAMEEVEQRAAITKGDSFLVTVGSVVQHYLDNYRGARTTLETYRSYANAHIYPRIGKLRLAKASRRDFARFFNDLGRPRDRGGAGLSLATVQRVRALLSGCFNKLVNAGYLSESPLQGMRMPQARSKEARALTSNEAQRLIEYLASMLSGAIGGACEFEGESIAAALWASLNSGVRRGELAGFQVKHWSLQTLGGKEAHCLRISRVLAEVAGNGGALLAKEPKTEASKRAVSMDQVSAEIIETHIELQRAWLESCGIAQNQDTPLFAKANGAPWHPSELTAAFRDIADALGFPADIHLHTLRHTHATYLLQHGESPRTVQKRLGHSKINTTLEVYGHVMPGDDAGAAESFAGIVEGMASRVHGGAAGPVVPVCPRTGETCARYAMPALNLQSKN